MFDRIRITWLHAINGTQIAIGRKASESGKKVRISGPDEGSNSLGNRKSNDAIELN